MASFHEKSALYFTYRTMYSNTSIERERKHFQETMKQPCTCKCVANIISGWQCQVPCNGSATTFPTDLRPVSCDASLHALRNLCRSLPLLAERDTLCCGHTGKRKSRLPWHNVSAANGSRIPLQFGRNICRYTRRTISRASHRGYFLPFWSCSNIPTTFFLAGGGGWGRWQC